MFSRVIGGGLVAASVVLCGFPAAAQERKPPSGRVIGELCSRQNTPDGKNAFFEVLSPGEEKPRRYHVLYDPQTKGPIDSVLAAVRAAAIGDRVELDWVQTGHGPAAKAFTVLSKAADAEVGGRVTLNGAPLGDGRIIFHLPKDQFVGAKLNAQGMYTVFRVPVGKWKVTIEGEGVPAKYASEGKTPLLVQLRHGENVSVNIELR